MSERFNQNDIALARGLRAVESANDVVLRASAELMTTMLDACEARKLSPYQGHAAIVQIGEMVTGAIMMRERSLSAHQGVAELGKSVGLPVTAWGDFCLAADRSEQPAAQLSVVGRVA